MPMCSVTSREQPNTPNLTCAHLKAMHAHIPALRHRRGCAGGRNDYDGCDDRVASSGGSRRQLAKTARAPGEAGMEGKQTVQNEDVSGQGRDQAEGTPENALVTDGISEGATDASERSPSSASDGDTGRVREVDNTIKALQNELGSPPQKSESPPAKPSASHKDKPRNRDPYEQHSGFESNMSHEEDADSFTEKYLENLLGGSRDKLSFLQQSGGGTKRSASKPSSEVIDVWRERVGENEPRSDQGAESSAAENSSPSAAFQLPGVAGAEHEKQGPSSSEKLSPKIDTFKLTKDQPTSVVSKVVSQELLDDLNDKLHTMRDLSRASARSALAEHQLGRRTKLFYPILLGTGFVLLGILIWMIL